MACVAGMSTVIRMKYTQSLKKFWGQQSLNLTLRMIMGSVYILHKIISVALIQDNREHDKQIKGNMHKLSYQNVLNISVVHQLL